MRYGFYWRDMYGRIHSSPGTYPTFDAAADAAFVARGGRDFKVCVRGMTVDEFLTEFERIAPTRDWTLNDGIVRTRAQNPATGMCDCPITAVARALFGTRGYDTAGHASEVAKNDLGMSQDDWMTVITAADDLREAGWWRESVRIRLVEATRRLATAAAHPPHPIFGEDDEFDADAWSLIVD